MHLGVGGKQSLLHPPPPEKILHHSLGGSLLHLPPGFKWQKNYEAEKRRNFYRSALYF